MSVQNLINFFNYDPTTGVVQLRRNLGLQGQRGDGTGYIDDLGYIRIYFKGKNYRAHQIAWLIMTGEWTRVDHKDLNKLNNVWTNLRKATKSQNAANSKTRVDNALGVKGVSFCSSTGRYRADIRFQGKSFNLGRYPTIEIAKSVYDSKAKELFGEFARS